MNILKLVFGGIVAVLSAFGTTLTVLVIAEIYANANLQKATGLGAVAGGWSMMFHNVWFWLMVFAIFALGFFLSYRKLYM